ncbi:MAG: hypothetical protein H0U85_03680 [Gemmatimonadales bacterium]|nr:hypothetical protein [Gemmatimonadales bacterium]
MPLAACVALSSALHAQGLPLHEPLNPTAAARSGVYAQPYVTFSPERWRVSVTTAYGNAIESESSRGASYLLDAEVSRTTFAVTRDLSAAHFLRVDAAITGAYSGFADGFFAAYHRLIHYTQPERLARPPNTFAYDLSLPGGPRISRSRYAVAAGDVRVTLGIRHSRKLQSVLSVTAPSATGPAGYGRGTFSLSTIHTVLLPLSSRIAWESTLGAGVTPRHGPLAPFQRALFGSASSGLRLRLWGAESAYGYLFYHTPYYHSTTLASLDRRELTGDFGWIHQGRAGRAWYVGLGEDFGSGDAGIDLVLKVGMSW